MANKKQRIKGVLIPGKILKHHKGLKLNAIPRNHELVQVTITTTGPNGKKSTSSGGTFIREQISFGVSPANRQMLDHCI